MRSRPCWRWSRCCFVRVLQYSLFVGIVCLLCLFVAYWAFWGTLLQSLSYRMQVVLQKLAPATPDAVEALALGDQPQGKAMIVCMRRDICVSLFNELIALRPEWEGTRRQRKGRDIGYNPEDGAVRIVMTGAAPDRKGGATFFYTAFGPAPIATPISYFDLKDVTLLDCAHNPDGATADEQANQAANRTLETEIEQAGHHHFPVTGGSPDFTHAEPGFGVTCTDEEALRLARQFRQEAVFKVEDGRVFLISALDTNAAPEEIGSWNNLILP